MIDRSERGIRQVAKMDFGRKVSDLKVSVVPDFD
jgi:hypothetical protein